MAGVGVKEFGLWPEETVRSGKGFQQEGTQSFILLLRIALGQSGGSAREDGLEDRENVGHRARVLGGLG